jgi:16S rRNA (cytidine1402-2'-O)-methyltransferase
MKTKGKLLVIPSVIADGTQHTVIPPQVANALPSIGFFLAEDVRTARRFLSSLRVYPSVETLQFEVLDKDTTYDQLPGLMAPAMEGHDIGVISESGCPGVADPGALAVRYAHETGIEVIPLVGPSSILLALMGSGLNGQRFAFHGYLPIDVQEATSLIRSLEKESAQRNQTQLFIETPYRNNHLFELLVKSLSPATRLTVAIDLTGFKQSIQTLPIKDWRKGSHSWEKLPAIFLFLA